METKGQLPDAEQLAENIAAQTALETEQANVAAAGLAWTLAQTMAELEPKTEPFEVAIGQQYFRMGRLCEMCQSSPTVLREICRRCDVRPVASIDDVAIFDGHGLLEILRYLDTVRKQHESKD